jgi:SnoaL-like domain
LCWLAVAVCVVAWAGVGHAQQGAFALYADTVESIEPGMPPAVGVEALKQQFGELRAGARDIAWQACNIWVDGDTILIQWNARVTVAEGSEQGDLSCGDLPGRAWQDRPPAVLL